MPPEHPRVQPTMYMAAPSLGPVRHCMSLPARNSRMSATPRSQKAGIHILPVGLEPTTYGS